jgi:hypothetical protein
VIAKLRSKLALSSAKRLLKQHSVRSYSRLAERLFMKSDTEVFNEKFFRFFNFSSDQTLLYRPLYMKIYMRLRELDQLLSPSIVALLLGYRETHIYLKYHICTEAIVA